ERVCCVRDHHSVHAVGGLTLMRNDDVTFCLTSGYEKSIRALAGSEVRKRLGTKLIEPMRPADDLPVLLHHCLISCIGEPKGLRHLGCGPLAQRARLVSLVYL